MNHKAVFFLPSLRLKKMFVNKNVLNGVTIHVFTASKHVFFQSNSCPTVLLNYISSYTDKKYSSSSYT